MSRIDLNKIFKSGQTFLWDRIIKSDLTTEYLIRSGDGCALIRQSGDAYIVIENHSSQDWPEYFDDMTDYDQLAEQYKLNAGRGGIIRAAVEAGDGLRILRQTPWDAAVQFILSQNNNIPRIKKCVDALAVRYNGTITVKRQKFAGCLPTAAQIARGGPGSLEGLGLGYRAAYLYNLARNWPLISKNLEKEDSYSNHFRTLCSVYGIGPKVANCICLFGLHDTEAVPVDTWIAKITERALGGVFPSDVPEPGVLQQYLFYAVTNCPEILERYLGEVPKKKNIIRK